MNVNIYALIDPRTHMPVYVGATRRELSKRLREHIAYPSSPKMKKLIKKLKSSNLRLGVELIESTSPETAWEREIYWMDEYAKKYHILNDMHNGRYNPSAIRGLPKIGYTRAVTVYVTPDQYYALLTMTTNVSAWVRGKIDREIRRTQTQEQRREAARSEATK